jgi:signal transduction histidine kinase
LVITVFSLNAHYTENLNTLQVLFQAIGFLAVGFLAIQISIEKKKYEDLVTQMQLFMNMVSHDVAQPITVIKLYTQQLEKNTDRNTKQTTRKMADSLHSLEKFIVDLKDITQAKNGKFAINPGKMDLRTLLISIVKEQNKNTKKHKIIVTTQPSLRLNYQKRFRDIRRS